MTNGVKMTPPVHPSIREAIQGIRMFVAETTGKTPTDDEIADALNRYFVLNEIKDHILMTREEQP
jgi:hypothetical protein